MILILYIFLPSYFTSVDKNKTKPKYKKYDCTLDIVFRNYET